MKAIQLDLFTMMPISEPEEETMASVTTATTDTNNQGTIKDPCKDCDLKEWCSDDDCGQKLFPIDVPYPPSRKLYSADGTRFRNLQEFILFKKAMGWL